MNVTRFHGDSKVKWDGLGHIHKFLKFHDTPRELLLRKPLKTIFLGMIHI